MLNLLKKIIFTLILIIPITIPFYLRAQLSSSSYFGGLILGQINCTCDGDKVMLLINDYSSGGVLTLNYRMSQLTTLFYKNYSPLPGHYLLGSYDKKVDMCQIIVGEGCIAIPAMGKLNSSPGTGTS